MRSDILKRPIISAMMFASLAACAEKSSTSPLNAELTAGCVTGGGRKDSCSCR
jgi:hypothetical protein